MVSVRKIGAIGLLALWGCTAKEQDDDLTGSDVESDSDTDTDTDSDTDTDTDSDSDTDPAVNVGPTAVDDDLLAKVTGLTKLDVTGNDTDADGVDATSVQVVTPGAGTVTADTTGGGFFFTPAKDFVGLDSFTYTVKDTLGAVSNVATVAVDVGGAPLLDDDFVVVNPDQTSVVIDVLANDTDLTGTLDPATLEIDADPTKGTATVVSGTLSYSPTGKPSGTDALSYTVADDEGNYGESATVSLTFNEAPEVEDDEYHVVTDQSTNLAVTQNDGDPDGLALGTLTLVQQGAFGTATVLADGSIDYVPAGDFQIDNLVYSIEDKLGAVSKGDVTIYANGRPVLNTDSAVVQVNGQVLINVRANDVEPDGDDWFEPSFDIVTNGQHGTAGISGTPGTISYAPQKDYVGKDAFSYTIKDEWGAAADVEGVVNVRVNAPPVANDDDDLVVQYPASLVIDVLGNDTDPDGDLLDASSVVVSSVSAGSVTVDPATGEVTYTPDEDSLDEETFVYTMNDAAGGVGDEATVTMFVNWAPEALDDGGVTSEDAAGIFNVLSNDIDANQDPSAGLDDSSLEIIEGTASGGTFTIGDIAGTPGITYVPTANFNGTASVDYRIYDHLGQFDEATLTIVVTAVNDAPTTDFGALLMPEGAAEFLKDYLKVNDIDSTPDQIVYTVKADPSEGDFEVSTNGTSWTKLATGGTFTKTQLDAGLVRFKHSGVQPDAGAINLLLSVKDQTSAAINASLPLTVSAVNDVPVCSPNQYNAGVVNNPDSPLTVNLITAGGCTDEEDGTNLTLVVGSPLSSDVSHTLTGQSITIAYEDDGGGPYIIGFQAKDSAGLLSAGSNFEYSTNDAPRVRPLDITFNVSWVNANCQASASHRLAFSAVVDEFTANMTDPDFALTGTVPGVSPQPTLTVAYAVKGPLVGDADSDATASPPPWTVSTVPANNFWTTDSASGTAGATTLSQLTPNIGMIYNSTTRLLTLSGQCVTGTSTTGNIAVSYDYFLTDDRGFKSDPMTTKSKFRVNCTCTKT